MSRFYGYLQNGLANLHSKMFRHFLTGNSTSQSPLSQHHRDRLQPFATTIATRPQGYTVVSTTDLSPVDPDGGSFPSRAAAEEYLARRRAAEPSLAGELQVLPDAELPVTHAEVPA